MFSHPDAFRTSRRLTATSIVSQVGGSAIVLASVYALSPVAMQAAEGFIVRPDGAPRFTEPVGDEANIAEILATRKQTDGVLGVWRYTAAPEFGPPLHIHAEEDELFYVLDGEFALQLGDCVAVAPTGSFVFIPKDTPHTYRNMRKEPGKLLGAVTPGGFEGFFQAAQGVEPEIAAKLMEQHALFAVGPPIDLAALESESTASSQAQSLEEGAYRIAVLAPGCEPPSPTLQTFLQGLRDLGYEEGRNLSIEWRYSKGNAERFVDLATELSRLDIDLIVTVSTPAALAAKQATQTVPIVMLYAADPEGTGLVASLARPDGNITGVSDMATQLSAKRLALLKEVVPTLSRLAVLWNSADPGMVLRFEELKSAAGDLGVTLESSEVRGPHDFEHAFSAMTQEPPDALFVIAEVLTITHRCRVLQFAEKNRLPAIYEFGLFAREGGLMAYGPTLTDSFRRGAYYVDEILKGAKPADLPVEQPENFELVVNLDTAESLGVTFPTSILLQSDYAEGDDDRGCGRVW
jgi:putative tryptophan/tyrosine transport system substrate-binding protein